MDVDSDRFKVWPTNSDREDFASVMSAGSRAAVERHPHADADDEHQIPDAYLYFAVRVDAFLTAGNGVDRADRLSALYDALTSGLHVVVIQLDREDDAQEIFETLNSLGQPLLPADLVKNYLFHRASKERPAPAPEALHRQYWTEFDDDRGFWRKEVRQGRLKRPRIDLFLSHYLAAETLDEDITVAHLFQAFKAYIDRAEGVCAADHMRRFGEYAAVYKRFESFPEGTRPELFFYRLREMDISTVYPLLLELARRHEGKGAAFDKALVDIESFIVRRAVCGLTGKEYNRFFLRLLKELKERDDFSPEAVRRGLLASEAETALWPDDDLFRQAWLERPLYKSLRRPCRMILEAVEASMRSPKSESGGVERGELHLEHLLPRKWGKHWPLECDEGPEGAEAKKKREAYKHRIGNLTLLTSRLNSSVKNAGWEKKRREINKHTVLMLNKDVAGHETWDEAMIDKRGGALLKHALRIWPRPQGE